MYCYRINKFSKISQRLNETFGKVIPDRVNTVLFRDCVNTVLFCFHSFVKMRTRGEGQGVKRGAGVVVCVFYFVEVFHLVEIRSVFYLYLHSGLEFFN